MKGLKRKLVYTAAFFTPVALFTVIMVLRHVLPFGDKTLLLWDANGQYLAFFSFWRRVLLGESDALYTLSRELGGGLAGLVAYYLASPLNILLVLFPETHVIEAFELIVLIKIGFCGLFMSIYLNTVLNEKSGESGVLLFSTAYALMGFVACYFWDIMWLDGVALLPLIASGISQLVRSGKKRLYVLTLALALFSNYYIGYMLCLFSVLYFLFVWFNEHGRAPFFRTAFHFGVSSVLAAALAAVMLIPAFCALTKGYGLPGQSFFSFERRFPMIELPTKLLTGAIDHDEAQSAGMPMLYVGIPVLILTGTFFFNSSIVLRRRISAALMLLLFALSFQNQTLYLIWHGFDSPDAMPGRFSFLCSFWLISLAAEGRKQLPQLPKESLSKRLCLMAAGAYAAGCIILRDELPTYLSSATITFDTVCMFASCMLIAMLISSRLGRRRAAIIGLCVLQTACLLLNGYLTMHRLEQSDKLRVNAFKQEFVFKNPLFEKYSSRDSIYRIETNAARNANDPLQYGYAGISHFSSDLQSGMIPFYKKLGLHQNHFKFEYGNGATPVAESLLGVKYILWDQDRSIAPAPSSIYHAVEETGRLTVYENPYALPLAVMVPAQQSYDPLAEDNPFINQNALLSDWIGGEWIEALENVKDVKYSVNGDTMHVEFASSAAQCSYFSSSGTWFSWNGGDYEEQDRLKGCIPLSVQDETFTLDAYIGDTSEEPHFYLARLNSNVFKQAMKILDSHACEVSSHTDSVFHIRAVSSAEASQLLTTLPYDEGWRAWVDGKQQKTCARYGTLLAVELEPGEHEVQLRYIPKGLPLGAAISAAALVICCVLWIRRKRQSRKTSSKVIA